MASEAQYRAEGPLPGDTTILQSTAYTDNRSVKEIAESFTDEKKSAGSVDVLEGGPGIYHGGDVLDVKGQSVPYM